MYQQTRSRLRMVTRIILAILALYIVTGCGNSAVYAPVSATSILEAILTGPEELVDARGTEEEKQIWKSYIGDYMTEDAFERFYESEERTRWIDEAEAQGVVLRLQDVKVEESDGQKQILLTALDVLGSDSSVKTAVLRWQIEYNEETEQILSLFCLNPENLWESD